MNKIIRTVVLFCAAALTLPALAYDVEWLYGTNPTLDPARAGTLIAEQTTPFTFLSTLELYHQPPNETTGVVSGNVVSRVVRTTDGTLDFYWQVQVDADAIFGVVQFDVSGFTGLPQRANYRADLGGDIRPELWVLDGGLQSFVFRSEVPNSVRPGLKSAYFFLDTDATSFSSDGLLALTSDDDTQRWRSRGRSDNYTTYSPLAVPEPQTWALLLLGLGAVVLASRRRPRLISL